MKSTLLAAALSGALAAPLPVLANDDIHDWFADVVSGEHRQKHVGHLVAAGQLLAAVLYAEPPAVSPQEPAGARAAAIAAPGNNAIPPEAAAHWPDEGGYRW